MRGFQDGIFMFLALPALETCAFGVKETGDFSGRSFPYEISKDGDNISNFSVFNIDF